MGDWADKKVRDIWYEYLKYNHTAVWLLDAYASALRDAAAEARAQAIEKSAALIGRQVEPRDA